MTESSSIQIRQEGNELYKFAMTPETSDNVREALLEKALQCFQRAVEESVNVDERSSAQKNAGKAAWGLAVVQTELQRPLESIQKSFHLAIQNLTNAESCGASKDNAWVAALHESQNMCFKSSLDCATELCDGRERAAFIEANLFVLSCNVMKAKSYLAIAQALFFESVVKLQEVDFKSALSLLHDCHYPLEEAVRVGREDLTLKFKINELRQDVISHLVLAEAIQAIETGDNMLEVVAKEAEDLNIDMVWEVIDWYRKALILTRDKDVENEAKAMSRLGCVFYEVLKLREKGRALLTRCMELCLTLYPKSPENQEWFKVCKKTLEKIQQEIQREEDNSYQEKRKGFLEQLKEELSKLKSIEEKNIHNPRNLLCEVYKVFPLSDKTKVMLYIEKKAWDEQMSKKAFQKAVLHYHPDMVDVRSAGMKHKVLYEEITKVLNGIYANYKISI